MTVLLGLAMVLPSTDAFFDNLIELPMNMAGYMSVARASTECEDQVLLTTFFLWKIWSFQVVTAVDVTIEEANRRCTEAVSSFTHIGWKHKSDQLKY